MLHSAILYFVLTTYTTLLNCITQSTLYGITLCYALLHVYMLRYSVILYSIVLCFIFLYPLHCIRPPARPPTSPPARRLTRPPAPPPAYLPGWLAGCLSVFVCVCACVCGLLEFAPASCRVYGVHASELFVVLGFQGFPATVMLRSY